MKSYKFNLFEEKNTLKLNAKMGMNSLPNTFLSILLASIP